MGRTHFSTSQPRRGFYEAFSFEFSAYLLDGCVVPTKTLDVHWSLLRLVKAADDFRGSTWDVLQDHEDDVGAALGTYIARGSR